ncbi:MAG: hypothetical protein ABI379_07155 [Rhodanobacter sp.]
MNSRLNLAWLRVDTAVAADARGALSHNRGIYKWVALGAALVAALAVAPGASAHDRYGHSGYRGGYSGHYVQPRYYNHGGYYRGGYDRGGYWGGGRWIAGAIVTGAVIGLINDVVAPPPVYYAPPVVYGPPPVVYESYPVPMVRSRVVVSPTVVYGDPYQTRYIRSDW